VSFNTLLDRESPKIAQITDRISELAKHADSVVGSVEPVVKHVDQAVVNVDKTVNAIREPLTKDLTELESTLQAARTVMVDFQNIVGSNEADIGETVRNLRSASENVRVLTDSLKQRPWSLIRTKQPADRRVPQ
jgi:ABC-type transporter Mla subunit MlaD